MNARTIEHDPDRTRAQLVAQLPQEDLLAVPFHGGQQQKHAGAGGGFDRRIQPYPLLPVLHDPEASVKDT
jgi:hypothetical protein